MRPGRPRPLFTEIWGGGLLRRTKVKLSKLDSWSVKESERRLSTMNRLSRGSSAFDPAHLRMRAEQVRRLSDGAAESEELAAIFDRRAVRAEEFLRDPIGCTKKENWQRHEHIWRKYGGEGDLTELQIQAAAAKLFLFLGKEALAHAANYAESLRQQGGEEDHALSERLLAAVEDLLRQLDSEPR